MYIHTHTGYIQEKKKKKALFRIKVTFIMFLTLKFNFTIVKKQCKFITDFWRVISLSIWGSSTFWKQLFLWPEEYTWNTGIWAAFCRQKKRKKKSLWLLKYFFFFLVVIYHIIKVSSTYKPHILQCITNIRVCYYGPKEHVPSQPWCSTERNIWRYTGLVNLFSKGYG